MIEVTVTGIVALRAKLKGIRKALHDALLAVAVDQGWALANYIKANKLSGQVLNVRTNKLRSSITCQITDDHSGVAAHVGIFEGPALVYGRAHEFGATIVPKKGQFLAIPVAPWAKGHSPMEFPDLFFVQSEGGQPMLARSLGGDSLDVGFLLRRKVVLPERSFLRSGFKDRKPVIQKAYTKAVGDVLKSWGVSGGD